jgi:uncharacterized protein YecE (DUF72 family)
MAELRIGSCSWKFPSWRGLVYSSSTQGDYLGEYARTYSTVEIDQWFWSLFSTRDVSLPDPRDVSLYRASVPEGFCFSVKVPNSLTLTHAYRKTKTDPMVANPHFLSLSLFQAFLLRLEAMRDVLGPLILQFGYLNQKMMESQNVFQRRMGAFFRQAPAGYSYALEIRNPRYLNESFFEFLRTAGVSPVFLQGYWMPPIFTVYEQWRPLVLQQKQVVIRLHGPDREGMEAKTGKRWDRIVEPRDEELEAVVSMVEDLLDQGVDVYLNVNNHYEGSAPLTIDRLRKVLGQEPLLQVYEQRSFDWMDDAKSGI